MSDQPEPRRCDYTEDGLRCEDPAFGSIESHAPEPFGITRIHLCAFHLGVVTAALAEFAAWKPKEEEGRP